MVCREMIQWEIPTNVIHSFIALMADNQLDAKEVEGLEVRCLNKCCVRPQLRLFVTYFYQGSIKSFADDSKRLRVAKSKKSLVKKRTEQSEKRDAQRKDSSHERKESHGLHGFTRHIRQKSNPKHSSKESDEKEDSQKHHGFLHFRGGRAGKPTHVYVHIHLSAVLRFAITHNSRTHHQPNQQIHGCCTLLIYNDMLG